MNSIKLASAALGLTAALAVAAAASAAPAARAPLTPGQTKLAPNQPVGTPLVIKALYENYSIAVSTIPVAAYSPLDALTTIKCTVLTGCSLHTKSNVQVWASADGGQFAIATQVDGVYINHSQFFQGAIKASQLFKMGTDQENATLSYGTHKVRTFVYLDTGGSLGSYDIVYRLTAP
jgi:hypothetical protein